MMMTETDQTPATPTSDVPAQQVYRVKPERLYTLQRTLDQLNRRAAKLGVTGVTYDVGELQTKIVRNPDEFSLNQTIVIAWHDVAVTTERVSLAGWRFIATLDHASEAGVVLRGVPGETVPTSYRDAAPACTHCGTARPRKETFVLLHEDGRYAQVGRQCVRDFLGVDPTFAARLAELSIAIASACDEDDWASGGGSSSYIPLGEYLACCAVAIRCFGWTSRSKQKQFALPSSTTADASMIMWPGRPDGRTATEKEAQRVTEDDLALAQSALEWAQGLRDTGAELSDYEHNLCVVASAEALSRKSMGIAASMIPAYRRAIGQELERRTAAATSTHVGTPGKREVFGPLTVLFLREYETNYGVSTICTFVDAAGNRLKWFASGAPRFEQGDVVTLKATVKEHGEWKGIKETTVSRAAVVEPKKA